MYFITIGLSSDGLFSISSGNTLNLTIPCSNMRAISSSTDNPAKRAIYSANLWFFPKPAGNHGNTTSSAETDSNSGTYTVTFTVAITADAASSIPPSQTTVSTMTWSTIDTCMGLDISKAVRRYGRAAMRRQDGLMDQCTISVTVQSLQLQPAAEGNNGNHGNSNICSAFNGRTCSSPFVFFTHVEGIIHQLDNEIEDAGDGNAGIAKRSIILEDIPATPEVCGVQDMRVNLTNTPLQVVYPSVVNIGICKGSCAVGRSVNSPAAGFRHSLLVSNPQYLIGSDIEVTPSCAPTSFDPLMIVIDDSQRTSIIAINEAIVTKCMCVV